MKPEIKLTNNLFIDYGEVIEEVLQRAVQDALMKHKLLGNTVAIWKDGAVVELPPELIVIDDSLEDRESKQDSG